jgi:hypothetical protein
MNQKNRVFALRTLLTLVTVALAAAPACAWGDTQKAEGQFERTLSVSGTVDLSVRTGSGSVTVTTGSGSEVRVLGKINVRRDSLRDAQALVREIESNPPIEQSGNTIRIGHTELRNREWRRNVSISYELVVPASTRLTAGTGSGSVSVTGIAGPLDASTGSGSITLSSIGSEVAASTGSGSIKIDGANGRLKASTGSGSIRATGVAGAMDASTGSGSITLEQIAAGDVEATTGSGGIEITGVKGQLRARTGSGSIRADGNPTGDWKLHSSSGSIRVRLPAQAAFELVAETSSGRIDSAHPVTVVGTISPRKMRGQVRGGGFLLDVSTSSGNIHID